MSRHRQANEYSEICSNCLKKKFIFETENKQYLENINKIIDKHRKDTNTSKLELELIAEYNKYFPATDYTEIKRHFNELLMSLLPKIEEHVFASNDPLYSAIKMSIVANYIDCSAFKEINDDKVIEILFDIEKIKFNNYEPLLNDLRKAKKLLYVLDNCGEVVLDKLVMKIIKQRYPNLEITAMIRGSEAVNDVSIVDAKQVNLYEVANVVDNGLDFAGVDFNRLSRDRQDLIRNVDVIISKGQANAESLLGSGFNIYYLFLCKCANFEKMFNVKLLTPLLEKEILD